MALDISHVHASLPPTSGPAASPTASTAPQEDPPALPMPEPERRGTSRDDADAPRAPQAAGIICPYLRALLLDSGVLGSNVVREGQCFFKTVEKEELQGGKGD